jgi:hypothetical protein
MTLNGKMTVKDELEGKEKNLVWPFFKVIAQHLPGRTAENHKRSVRITDIWPRTESRPC